MVTQLLFGEHFTIIGEEKDWYHISVAFDKYDCWVHKKQSFLIDGNLNMELNIPQPLSTEMVHPICCMTNNSLTPIVLGSTLPFIDEEKFSIDTFDFKYDGNYTTTPLVIDREKLIETACLYLNAPYLWGGRSPFGIDCSGFTQMVFKLNGIALLRDAFQQAEMGSTLSFVEEATAGDLAFFDNEEGRITHVGILLSDKKIIHASGNVRIDTLDHQGIYNAELNKYSHNLRVIKKII